MSDATQGFRLEGRHVLALLAGFFGVMLAVNMLLVWLALSTFAGIDTPDAYRRGLAYNATVAEAAAQEELGWTADVSAHAATATLRLAIADRSGRPVAGIVVSGRLLRPASDREDRVLANFAERTAGHYEASLAGIAPGAWIADLEARSPGAGDPPFRLKERLWLKPAS